MLPKALRIAWKIVAAGFALWGFAVALFMFAFWAKLLPASTNRIVRAGLSMSRAEARRQQRPPTPRQISRQTFQQTPPVDGDAEAPPSRRRGRASANQQVPPVDADSAEEADSADDAPEPSSAAERGHRHPPQDRTDNE